MSNESSLRASGRRKLLLLLALFAAPVVAAYTLYFWTPKDWQPEGRTNQGRLVSPPRAMESLSLHDVAGQRVDQGIFSEKWTLLLVGPSSCGEVCQQRLFDTRQVRTALGKNTLRVQRVLVTIDRVHVDELQKSLATEHPDLTLLVAEGAEVYALNRHFSASDRNPMQNPYDIYLLDPLGNWLMFYQPEDPAKGLLKDLKKLLRLSNIG